MPEQLRGQLRSDQADASPRPDVSALQESAYVDLEVADGPVCLTGTQDANLQRKTVNHN